MPNLGDVTKVDWSSYRGRADVIVGGPPCQAFSIAGLRNGLRDPRGNMTLEYLRAIDEVRPQYVVFENVPGIISDKTHAFDIFLDGLQQLGYLIDMDILDAQYFGVAQRRKRVFVLGVRVDALIDRHDATSRLVATQLLCTAIRQAMDGDATVSMGRLRSFGMGSAEDLADWLGVIGCDSDGCESLWGALREPDRNVLARWLLDISDGLDGVRPSLPIFANEGLSIFDALEEFAAHAKQKTEQPGLFDGFDDVLYNLGREAARRAESLGDLAEACTREVLPEPESLPRNTQTSREKREALARAAGRGAGAGGCEGDCLTPWDVQSKRVFTEDGAAPTLSSGTGEGINIQPSVLQSQSIDYKQTPKVCDEVCHTITREGSGGIHSAVAIQTGHTSSNGSGINTEDVSYTVSTSCDQAVAFAQNTRDEVRLVGGDGSVTGTLAANAGAKQQSYVAQRMAATQYGDEIAGTLTARADSSPCADKGQNVVCHAFVGGYGGNTTFGYSEDRAPTVTATHPVDVLCVADEAQNATTDDDLSGTLKAGGYSDRDVLASNGDDVIGALCARDYKGVGSQYVREGKVICQRAES